MYIYIYMMMICTVGDGMVILNFDEGPLII